MNMKPRKLLFFLWLILLVQGWPAATVRGQQSSDDLKPTLILISIDGFRADYLAKYPHPTLDALAREGVRARWMTPSYPSLTFPNHYAIVTGLYPEHHGIVGNDMYDPVFDAEFGLSKREEVQNSRWWGGEPIWITAEKQGQKASATFWPGSEAEIRGTRPTYFKSYDDKVPPPDRVAALLSLLDLPLDQRPTFLTLYFSDVDHAGHDFSPNSPEVAKAVSVVDKALERLVRGLRSRNLDQRVNIIIVSDHGMAPVPPSNIVILDDYFKAKDARHIVWGGQVTNIFPRDGEEAALFSSIKRNELRHARCYRKQDVPARFHYRASRRIGAIVCMADEGWRLLSRARYKEDMKKPDRPTNVRGAHGYDNQLASMRAIFIARGPAFRRRAMVKPFPNVNVYNIMARVLGLTPAKNDGAMTTARAVLR
jgi:predicted AlkP superfamily pyrophosphatase or phosphodiesterase